MGGRSGWCTYLGGLLRPCVSNIPCSKKSLNSWAIVGHDFGSRILGKGIASYYDKKILKRRTRKHQTDSLYVLAIFVEYLLG